MQVHAHAPRHVVDHYGHRTRIGDGLEMGFHAALVGLIIIRYDAQNPLYASEILCFNGFDDTLCVVAAHAEHDGQTAIVGFQYRADYQLLFVCRKGRGFGSGAQNDQKIRAVGDDMVHDVD